jgi:hypothetical protein
LDRSVVVAGRFKGMATMTASRSLGAAPAALLMFFLLPACRPGSAERMAAEPASGTEVLANQNLDMILDKERTTVEVEVPPAAPEAAGKKLGLYLEGVDFGRPGVYFEVYAELPPGAEPEPEGTHYLGTLSSYGPKGQGTTVGFDITRLVRELEAQGRWNGKLSLTFVRRGLEPAPGKPKVETAPKKVPSVRVKRMKIVRE